MKAFLRQVAAHYWGPDIQDTVFVFPNRRSMVFFRKYLSEVCDTVYELTPSGLLRR